MKLSSFVSLNLVLFSAIAASASLGQAGSRIEMTVAKDGSLTSATRMLGEPNDDALWVIDQTLENPRIVFEDGAALRARRLRISLLVKVETGGMIAPVLGNHKRNQVCGPCGS